ncbi:MAG: translocation/assembly module TamB domain-containing protein [Paludibacteraceae bacterium]|nr:translocation/assembly module TamB domain-containing protein [Paludibacteraceae bacterium]
MKRSLSIIGAVVAGVVLIISILFVVVTSDRVGTALAQRVAEEFSRTMGANARIGSVAYQFPARLTLRDIYIEDQQQDTLLYLQEIYAHFNPLALRHDEIRFSHAKVIGGRAKMYEVDSTGVWNYQFMLDALQTDTTGGGEPLGKAISVRDIQLRDLRLMYGVYEVALREADIDVGCFSPDSIDARIDQLAMCMSAIENSGPDIELVDFQAHVCLADSTLSVPTLYAQTPNSRVELSGAQYCLRDASFMLPLKHIEIVPADFALLVPPCKGLKKALTIAGDIHGTADIIQWDDLEIRYDGWRIIDGDIRMQEMRINPYLKASLNELYIPMIRLQDMLSQIKGEPMALPKELLRLNEVRYAGIAEGYIHDLHLNGAFSTGVGTLTTTASMQSDSLFEHLKYDVRIDAQQVKLGKLTANPLLGSASLVLSTTGEGVVVPADSSEQDAAKKREWRGGVSLAVQHLTYNSYAYQDLSVEGSYAPQLYDVHLRVKDDYLDVAMDGMMDMQDNPLLTMQIDCRQLDTYPLLEEDKKASRIRSAFKMAAELNGWDAEDSHGTVTIDSLFLATELDSILMRQLHLASVSNAQHKSITLRSDYLNAQMDGSFRYADILPACQSLLHHYLPSAIQAPHASWKGVEFVMRAEGERLSAVQRLYDAPFAVSDHPRLDVSMRVEKDSVPMLDARVLCPGARLKDTPMKNLLVTLNTLASPSDGRDALTLALSAETLRTRTMLTANAYCDTIDTQIAVDTFMHTYPSLPEGWQQMEPKELRSTLLRTLSWNETRLALLGANRSGVYGGEVRTITHFSAREGKPLIEMHILPDTLILRDSIYTLGESRISYCAADTSIAIDGFSFRGNGQFIEMNGVASSRHTDSLKVDLQKVDASYVVPFILPEQTIMFEGLLTGTATIEGVFKQPTIDADIDVEGMGLNDCYFGDAEVDLHIYPERQLVHTTLPAQLQFHADVNRSTRRVVGLDGEAFFDGSGRWKLDMQADSVPLDFINHWTSSVLHDLNGHASGQVVVGGEAGGVYVLVNAEAQNASFVLPWTGARYYIDSDTIVLDTTMIRFPEVHARDAEGHMVLVNGGIHHNQFRDFVLDLHVDTYNALVFNTNKQGEMLQGKVYANGHVDVTGPEDDILVSANAVTTGKSQFRLSVDNVSSAYSANFVHFKQHIDTTAQEEKPDEFDNLDIRTAEQKKTIKTSRAQRCLLALNIEVNPQLLFQLVLGERNGDMIQAHGVGALRLTYDTQTGDVRLLGTYDIEQGTLSYTVANVIKKEFAIADGSTIVFSGDPNNPQLDVTAKYRVTASLKDLFGEEVDQLATTRTSIPVFTCLHIKGTLNNPILSFSLEFPSSDQTIQQQVQQVINTDEMLMRQVIYLLVFGRFFTPEHMMQAEHMTLNSTYSLLSSTVTGQINTWLSKLTDVLTLGVAIRTDGEGANSSQEYEAQFQLQPIDRLVINGNVGYRYNDISNQPFFGDLDVEVMLTEDGQFRLKGYTHTVDKYSLREASTIQGVGFVWKKDFNWPSKKQKGKKPTPSPSLKGRELKGESEELKVESQEKKVENKE